MSRLALLLVLLLLAACQTLGGGPVEPEKVPAPPAAPVTVAIEAPLPEFFGSTSVLLKAAPAGAKVQPVVRYTLDGSVPTQASPIANGPVTVERSAKLQAAAFASAEAAEPAGPVAAVDLHAWEASALASCTMFVLAPRPGLRYAGFAPELNTLEALLASEPRQTGVVSRPERLAPGGCVLEGWLGVPVDGVYRLESADGTRVLLDGRVPERWTGLRAGWHSLRIVSPPDLSVELRCFGPQCPADGAIAAERFGR